MTTLCNANNSCFEKNVTRIKTHAVVQLPSRSPFGHMLACLINGDFMFIPFERSSPNILLYCCHIDNSKGTGAVRNNKCFVNEQLFFFFIIFGKKCLLHLPFVTSTTSTCSIYTRDTELRIQLCHHLSNPQTETMDIVPKSVVVTGCCEKWDANQANRGKLWNSI